MAVAEGADPSKVSKAGSAGLSWGTLPGTTSLKWISPSKFSIPKQPR
jgi:hypothetical protein